MLSDKKPLIIAAIPAFNEEKTIAKVILLAQRHVDRVVVCDDGSSDMTAAIAEKLGVEVIRHEKNRGYGTTMQTLFKRARELNADIMVTVDADGQHDPDQMPRVVQPILDGKADVVIGSRFAGETTDMPSYRKAGVQVITKLLNRIAGANIKDAESGFRAYSSSAIKMITPTEQGMSAGVELLYKALEAGLTVIEVPVSITYKGLETSTQSPVTQGLEVISGIVKHLSIRHPLMFYGGLGFIASIFALVTGAFALNIYIHTSTLPLDITLMAIVSGMIGLILIAISVILFTVISVIREKP